MREGEGEGKEGRSRESGGQGEGERREREREKKQRERAEREGIREGARFTFAVVFRLQVCAVAFFVPIGWTECVWRELGESSWLTSPKERRTKIAERERERANNIP